MKLLYFPRGDVEPAPDVAGVGRDQQQRLPLPGARVRHDAVPLGGHIPHLQGDGAQVAALAPGPAHGVGAHIDGGVEPEAGHGEGPLVGVGDGRAVGPRRVDGVEVFGPIVFPYNL